MKLFITRLIPEVGIQLLEEEGFQVTEWREHRNLTQEELVHFCLEHDALLSAGHNQLDRSFFSACRHLKAISLFSAGYDRVDIAAATHWKIPVGHTPGVLSKATANVAFLLMLAVSRNAFFLHKKIMNDNWKFYDPTADLGIDVEHKTLGIFGMGRIGMELAYKCKQAFHMK